MRNYLNMSFHFAVSLGKVLVAADPPHALAPKIPIG